MTCLTPLGRFSPYLGSPHAHISHQPLSRQLLRQSTISGTRLVVSGKAMARTGLRMMPTFPSPPLKFRTASFPRYGFKAGMSDKAFPKTWFAIVLRAHCFHRVLPALCQGRCAGKAPPCERTQPLYPRGSRSGPGYAVPVHHHLVSPIRPTRGHTPTSPLGGLYEMPSLCLFA